MRIFLTTLIAIILSSSIMAQDNMDFATWDKDDDGLIEHYEFTQMFINNFFKSWDPTAKEGILEEDFFKHAYAGLDTDNDRYLSDEEWLIGYNYYYDDYVVHDEIAYIDENGDGRLEFTEYYDVLYDSNYFTDIDLDADNYISEYELADFVFGNWDINDSGTVSRSEFNNFKDYYLDV